MILMIDEGIFINLGLCTKVSVQARPDMQDIIICFGEHRHIINTWDLSYFVKINDFFKDFPPKVREMFMKAVIEMGCDEVEV